MAQIKYIAFGNTTDPVIKSHPEVTYGTAVFCLFIIIIVILYSAICPEHIQTITGICQDHTGFCQGFLQNNTLLVICFLNILPRTPCLFHT